jgi:hypothetical protein
MGRYFTGDIEGKFWFAVQSSTSADRFGVTHAEPSYVEYYFDESNIDDIKSEIDNIEKDLGDKLGILNDFFEQKDSYSDKDIDSLGISRDELSEYADLLLGYQIRDCVEENGHCCFDAEL